MGISSVGPADQSRKPENQGGVNLPNLVAGLTILQNKATEGKDKNTLGDALKIVARYLKEQTEGTQAAQRLARPQ